MRLIEHFWYRVRPAHLILYPLSLLFGAVAALRRLAFRAGWLRSERMPVPVIVAGNISVGGTGKTPLVIWLVERLRAHGMHPGIVSRGHGGQGLVRAVTPDTDTDAAGDEPVLLAARSDCPVWIGRRRAEAARALLRAHPEVDVLVCDDGLQHYALARDAEIAVVDGERRFGNGMLLPAGPLREPRSRLAHVNAIVINGGEPLEGMHPPQFSMQLSGDMLVNLRDPAIRTPAAQFAQRTVHAVAGIGNPERFFAHLRALGMRITAQPFPDHHRFSEDDLALFGDGHVVMTQKDAVKCRAFARDNFWYLPVDAQVDDALGRCLLDTLKARNGRQAP
ncbi:MAG: tetraacyldisaccharide 4'-kinase [Burkholderiales bacterium]|nr:tetraacyldisaccharide 4'-kinase [Burkholderiales bacterium]